MLTVQACATTTGLDADFLKGGFRAKGMRIRTHRHELESEIGPLPPGCPVVSATTDPLCVDPNQHECYS